jgi:hypothetical protein
MCSDTDWQRLLREWHQIELDAIRAEQFAVAEIYRDAQEALKEAIPKWASRSDNTEYR